MRANRTDIHGNVLEIGDSSYTDRFGHHVKQREIVDIDRTNRRATIVADLAACEIIPSNQFDCFVLVQTLQLIYDVKAAIWHSHRVLRPGGVLLVTVPCVSRLVPDLPDYWRFTAASCNRLFGEVFGSGRVSVHACGNVLVDVASLMGMAREELSPRELDKHDEQFPLIIAIRAIKEEAVEADRS